MPRYKQIGRVSALRCRRPPASIAFCPRQRSFTLLKPARGVILARNRPESGECRLPFLFVLLIGATLAVPAAGQSGPETSPAAGGPAGGGPETPTVTGGAPAVQPAP